MTVTGIICEYNPLHLGHRKQLDVIRSENGPDSGIVCLMSGNFVQRGAPAIVDKMRRAQAAILSGADLVLELPVTAALSSAEGFAAGGVEILSPFCDMLCFGAENADKTLLMSTAEALLREDFPEALQHQLQKGLSFPAAREAALAAMGVDTTLLRCPNNILALEYCKAILSQHSSMLPYPIVRNGNYHDTAPDPKNPSATALRQLMLTGQNWQQYVPEAAIPVLEGAPLHSLEAGERAILAKLRTMTDAEFEALPYGSEGLWRKFMHACRKESTIENIIAATKSKRYTRTRLDRMLICAFLGITRQDLSQAAPYCRVLAFNDRGRKILKEARKSVQIYNIGQQCDHPYQALEDRCSSLYGLFCEIAPESPEADSLARVFYHPANNNQEAFP